MLTTSFLCMKAAAQKVPVKVKKDTTMRKRKRSTD